MGPDAVERPVDRDAAALRQDAAAPTEAAAKEVKEGIV